MPDQTSQPYRRRFLIAGGSDPDVGNIAPPDVGLNRPLYDLICDLLSAGPRHSATFELASYLPMRIEPRQFGKAGTAAFGEATPGQFLVVAVAMVLTGGPDDQAAMAWAEKPGAAMPDPLTNELIAKAAVGPYPLAVVSVIGPESYKNFPIAEALTAFAEAILED